MIALGSAYLHHASGVDGAGFDAGGHGFALALHPVLAQVAAHGHGAHTLLGHRFRRGGGQADGFQRDRAVGTGHDAELAARTDLGVHGHDAVVLLERPGGADAGAGGVFALAAGDGRLHRATLDDMDAGDEFVALFQGLFKGQAVVGGNAGDFAAAARLALFRDRFDHVTAHGIFLANFRSQSWLSAGVDAGDEEVPAAFAFQPQASAFRAAAARRGHGKFVPALKAAPFGGDGRDVQFGPFRHRAFRVQLEARFQRFGLHRREQPHRKPHPRDPAHVVAFGLVFEDVHHACDDGCFVHFLVVGEEAPGEGAFFKSGGHPHAPSPGPPPAKR